MDAREKLRRGYRVTVRQEPGSDSRYRVSYAPLGLMQVRGLNGAPKRVPDEFRATAEVQGEDILIRWDREPSDRKASTEDFEVDVRARLRTLRAWLRRLAPLVTNVRQWAEDLGWSARIVEKPLSDSEIGEYKAPGLVLQRDMTKLGLEPIGRSAPGVQGVVDLYVLPAYDDIATLFLQGDVWTLHHAVPDALEDHEIRGMDSRQLTAQTFRDALEAMIVHDR